MESDEEVQVGGVHTIESVELSPDAKYYLTVTDGVRRWRLKYNRKKLNEFRDSLRTPISAPIRRGILQYERIKWIFTEKAEQDYERLMEQYNGPVNQ